MALLVVGLNHRTASVEVRERCALGADALSALTYRLSVAPVLGVVILATCNRLEIYADTLDPAVAAQQIQHTLCTDFDVPTSSLYMQTGQAAVVHLLSVACGLDSMVLGESQILGQVADAYQHAQQHPQLTPLLHRLFSLALETGKRAHTQTHISRHSTSVSHVALNLAQGAQTLLIVGAGVMAEQAARAAQERNIAQIYVVNRTYASAQALAQQVGGTAYLWSELWTLLHHVDAVICATGAPHTVLQTADLARVVPQRSAPLTLIDIALPRDVEPSARAVTGVCLYDLDDLQRVVDANLRQREQCIPHVQRIIQAAADDFKVWLHGREVVPTLVELRRKVESVAQAEVAQTLARLEHLDRADQLIVERLAHRLVNKILHEPTINLRQRAQDGNADDYSRVLRELFDLLPEETRHV